MSSGNGWLPSLVALDVDGTIVDYDDYPGTPTAPVNDAIRRVADAGAHVVIATGRSLHSTTGVFEQLGLKEGYAVCSNGAVLVDVATAEPATVVTFDISDPVRYFMDNVPDALLAVEELGRGYRVTGDFPVGELDGDVEVVDHEDLMAEPASRLVVRWPGGDPERLRQIAHSSGLTSIDYALGYTAWMDVMPAGVTKASGLTQVTSWLGLTAPDALAVGDGNNDLAMLAWAGRGVAMGQSPENVKTVADDVCGDVEDDGLAALLTQYFGSTGH